MKLSRAGLCCAVALWLAPPIWARQQPAKDKVEKELAALRARLDELGKLRVRLDSLEKKYARQHEQDQQTIAELRRQLAALQSGTPPASATATNASAAAEHEAEGEDELESLLDQIGGEGAATAEAPRSGVAQSLGRAFQSFNPDISVIGDFVGHYSNREGGELDDEMLLREIELGFSGAVDPYTRADVFLGISREDGDWGIDVEEAYLTYLGLPADLQARVGRFKSSFGKANPVHTHALPWVEYPFVIQNYFGEEGLAGEGLGLSWLVPNPWNQYIELTYEVINNDSTLFAGEEADDFVHLAHLKHFMDLSDSASLETGLSFATAPNDHGHGGHRTNVEGLDLTYKWRPPQTGLYHAFLWQTELMAAQAELTDGQEATWGMYTAADYQFARRWSIGTRYDYSQPPDDSSRREHGLSAYLKFIQSEYVYWRLAYQYTDRNFPVDGNKQEHEVFLQCNFGLGPHRAHKY